MAVMAALFTMICLVLASLSVDIASQVRDRHQLQDAVEVAARAAAADLPASSAGIRARATALAQVTDSKVKNATVCDPVNPTSGCLEYRFYCVVNSIARATGPGWDPDPIEFGVLCKTVGSRAPGGVDYHLACNSGICSIRCQPTLGDTCNTVQVRAYEDVSFMFAPLFELFGGDGVETGSTGWVGTGAAACKGACGGVPNPMDVVVVGDRTGSMSTTDRNSMVNGIKSMLRVMTPVQQYVAFGTIGPTASSPGTCKSSPSTSTSTGSWIATQFTNDYLNAAHTDVNANSQLVKDLNCLSASSGTVGTALASPLKAAARYLRGASVGASNNLSTLPNRDAYGVPTKVIIFETDGQPNEQGTTGGSTALTSSSNIFSNSNSKTGPTTVTSAPVAVQSTAKGTRRRGNTTYTDTYNQTTTTTTKTTTTTYNGGQNACANFAQVATNAKNLSSSDPTQRILVITIAYNLTSTKYCGDNNDDPGTSSATSDTDSAVKITAITPTSCRSGSGTTGSPYTLNTSCNANATITQTMTRARQIDVVAQAANEIVTNVLASAATPKTPTQQSAANLSCTDPDGAGPASAPENLDGDYYFCAATGTDMAVIFKTALAQAQMGVKNVKLPPGA